jgi:hypothetical protein
MIEIDINYKIYPRNEQCSQKHARMALAMLTCQTALTKVVGSALDRPPSQDYMGLK